jgi:hypothetical protein
VWGLSRHVEAVNLESPARDSRRRFAICQFEDAPGDLIGSVRSRAFEHRPRSIGKNLRVVEQFAD